MRPLLVLAALYVPLAFGCGDDEYLNPVDTGGAGGNAASGDPIGAVVVANPLLKMLTEHVEELGTHGAVLAVCGPGQQRWIGAAGLADIELGHPMRPNAQFAIGSITKTFTATVVLQLVDEGKLALTDPLSAYVPSFPLADMFTIEHLLSHTSGIPDVMGYMVVQSALNDPWTPEQLIWVVAPDVKGDKLGSYSYSNTNYLLLGLVIEAVTASSWEQQVKTRLLEPAGLEVTKLTTTEAAPELVPGYFIGNSNGWDWFTYPGLGWAAGSMVTNADELCRWLEVLLHGDLLSAAMRDRMKAPSPTLGGFAPYGLGLEVYATEYGTHVGHTGDAILHMADLQRIEDEDITVVFLSNTRLDHFTNAHFAWDAVLELSR